MSDISLSVGVLRIESRNGEERDLFRVLLLRVEMFAVVIHKYFHKFQM